MKLKFIITFLLFNTFLVKYSHAQSGRADSIRKCLYGEWQQIAHHKVQTISFDPSIHILKIKKNTDSLSYCHYTVRGDSLFVSEKKNTWKARIIFIDCDRIELEMNDDYVNHKVAYIRRNRVRLNN